MDQPKDELDLQSHEQPNKQPDLAINIFSLHERRGRKLMQAGLAKAIRGRADEAIILFKASIEYYPTAEAYTYWAWMVSQGDDSTSSQNLGQNLALERALECAIDLCHRAIETDPTLGNPYNDIGTYLMKQGLLDEAVIWLEKAKLAPRYDARQFPYINLGRIYLSQCLFLKALKEFDVALSIEPLNEELRIVVSRIRTRFNHE